LTQTLENALPKATQDFYRGRRVLVTGGLGFIGSNLARALVRLDCKVTIVDAFVPGHGANVANVRGIESDVEIHRFDAQDAERLAHLVEKQSVIFNLAGQVSHLDSMQFPEGDIAHNLLGPLGVLEACRKTNRNARVLYAGTRGQCGRPKRLPVPENAPFEPVDPNGVNKIAGEMYHLLYHRLYGIPACSLRLTNTYGPRHQMRTSRQGFLSWFIRQALDGETIQIYGDGAQLRDFTHVADVVRAFLLAGASEASAGKTYNLGSGHPISVRDIATLVIRLAGSGELRCIPYPPDKAPIEIGDYCADWTRNHEDLGWEPLVSLDAGLRETIAFYRENSPDYWP